MLYKVFCRRSTFKDKYGDKRVKVDVNVNLSQSPKNISRADTFFLF